MLLQLQQGNTPAAVAQLVGVSPAMVYNIRNRYQTEGLKVALSEKPRPGQPSTVTAHQLSNRLVWHYTPIHASWLNMAEPGGRSH